MMRFDPSSGKFTREVASVEQRTPAQAISWLTNWNEKNDTMDDVYGLSVWVQRAVRFISGPIAQVDLRFYSERPKGKRKSEVEIRDSRLEEFWKRPAQGCGKNAKGRLKRLSRVDTIEATVGWMCMAGEFFWILDDTWLKSSAVKTPFIIARPESMREILDGGELIGWIYTDGGGRQHALITEQVISSGFWNPNNPHRGAAPAKAAMMAAKADYAAGKFWKALAESNGDQGMTVIAPNGIDDAQAEQIKMVLKRKREAAKRGDYQATFFVGDVKTEDPKIQSPDASAVTQRMTNRHEVFAAFGVPPSFAEVVASYSVGSASDRYKLIEETCMPIAAKIAEAVEEVCELLTGNSVTAEFDFEEHSTMQEVRSERLASGQKLHERGVPWSVISDHLNLGLPDFAGSDKAWLPFNVQEVKGKEVPSADPAAKATNALAELEELFRGCSAHTSHTHRSEPAKLNKVWEKLMKTRAPYVKRVRLIIERALYEARKETLANISAAADESKAIRAGAFDFIFDIGKFLELIVEPVFRVLVDSYEVAGNELLKDEMGSDDPFVAADPQGLAMLQARKNFLRDTGLDIWEAIRDNLEEGIVAGESFEKLSERVREKFNGITKERSMRIAVTEVGISMESGRHEAMIQAGAEWKTWITSGDERVRLSHDAVNGTIVPMFDPFIVGGASMMYPCDPNAPVSEIINCRCIHGPSASPEGGDIVGNDPSPSIPF